MKKLNDFLEKTTDIYEIAQYVFLITFIILAIIPLRINGLFYIGLPILNTLAFFFYKDYEPSKNPNTPFKIFRMNISFFVLSIPHYLILLLDEKTGMKIPFGIGLMFGLPLFITITYLLFNDSAKKKQAIDKINIRNKLPKNNNQKENNYDVVLCKDKETGEDVIFEEDARYTHLFVDGPTGCGKTSQILTPMLWYDISRGRSVIVIEPKGDLAEKVYAMGKMTNDNVLYFNPTHPDCPSFNPLNDREDKVIETLTTIFNMLSPDSATYFKNITDNLLRKSIMVLKRIEQAYIDPNTMISSRPATLIGLSDILHNTEGRGRDYLNELLSIPCLTASEEKQNRDTVDWFLTEYYADRSKVYENSDNIRTQVSKLIQNNYLRKALNPENGISDINFDKILAEGSSIAISTAQGDLGELGSYLGYFLIFSLQSAIFRRPGNEFTRRPTFIYIDEAQKYLNVGFTDVLTQGRSYRCPVVLASQARTLLTMNSGRDGKNFLEVINSNARSIVAFPGISQEDAKYFSLTFGEKTEVEERVGESKQKFTFGNMNNMRGPTESIQRAEVIKPTYSETDIIFKPFSEITYRIIKNKSVQMARDGIASWIPKEINDRLDEIVAEYNNIQQQKKDRAEKEEWEQRKKIYEDFRRGMNGGGRTLGDLSSQSKRSTVIRSEQEQPQNQEQKKVVQPAKNHGNANAGNRAFVAPQKEKVKSADNIVKTEQSQTEETPLVEFEMPTEFDINSLFQNK